MKLSSTILALATLLTFSVNFNGVTGRALGGGALVTDGGHSIPNTVDGRGLTGPGSGTKGGKGGKGGKGDDDGSGGTSSGGDMGGLGGGKGAVVGGLGASGSMSATNRELDNLGLVRTDKGTARNEGAFATFNPTAGKDWKQFSIDAKDDKKATYGDKPIYQYQTFIQNGGGAFNTKWVETENRNLPDAGNRRTLTKNAWTDAGGDLGKLVVLGDSTIINDAVRASIHDAVSKNGKDAGSFPLTITIKRDEAGWTEINNNAFLGGYTKMLSEDTTAFKGATVGQVKIIIDSTGTYHLMTTLVRPKPATLKRPASESPDDPESAVSDSVSDSSDSE
ncbi:hypothetical protein BJ170DRAFT_682131 [Xylariales sp. AK1849]|nr:hypothetical protein BJ170DRAFT_682131 [Xylariales sp. AK1849]